MAYEPDDRLPLWASCLLWIALCALGWLLVLGAIWLVLHLVETARRG